MFGKQATVARVTGASALAMVLLYVVSVTVGSLASAPASDASAAQALRFVIEHRGGLLAAVVLNGLAWCALMPVVFAGLRGLLGPAGGLAATVSYGCALVVSAMVGVALVLFAMAAYAAPGIGAQTAKLLIDGGNLATVASAWPTVPCATAMAIALRSARLLPRAAVWLAWASVAINAVATVSFARAGALSPTGISLLTPVAFALWMAVIGVSLVRRATHAPAPELAGA